MSSVQKKINHITWRCVKRGLPSFVIATASTTKNSEKPHTKTAHNRPPDETRARVTKCRSDMKLKPETTRDEANQISSFATVQDPDYVEAHLPSADTGKRVSRRARGGLLSVPQSHSHHTIIVCKVSF